MVLVILSGLAAKAAAPLELTIVPGSSHEKSGAWIRTVTPFYAVLTNRSQNPVRVWCEWCSWGYFALTLEAEFQDGKIVTIKKRTRDWYKNFPDHFVITPGAHFVMPVKLSEEWEGYPIKEQRLRLRARYRIGPEEDSKEQSVWTGEIDSPWIEATISE